MAKRRGKSRHYSRGRRIRRSRRGTATHSVLLTVFGVGVALQPLLNNPNSSTPAPLTCLLSGQWQAGLWGIGANVMQNWPIYLGALVPVVVAAIIIKKFSRRLKLSKHWTV